MHAEILVWWVSIKATNLIICSIHHLGSNLLSRHLHCAFICCPQTAAVTILFVMPRSHIVHIYFTSRHYSERQHSYCICTLPISAGSHGWHAFWQKACETQQIMPSLLCCAMHSEHQIYMCFTPSIRLDHCHMYTGHEGPCGLAVQSILSSLLLNEGKGCLVKPRVVSGCSCII